ncbi:MAG: rhomboid family intramembrane serine protease [Anaerolineaceae bacterium]|nr:rhomboid family intramembrane serine protease [Anaerolineaceae bacterium]
MLPIGVIGKDKSKSYVTYGLIVVNILVFIWELSVQSKGVFAFQAALGEVAFNVCRVGIDPLPNLFVDSFRTMFLHGSLLHLIGNMLYLWIFGRRVEAYFGSWKYLVFYIAAGSFATLGHVLFGGVVCRTATELKIVIGASGAIAGVMGGFLMLYPTARVKTLIGFFQPLFWQVKLPAVLFLGYWFIMDLLQGVGWLGVNTSTAHWAHIGGFVSGVVMVFLATMLYKPAPKPDPFEYLDD